MSHALFAPHALLPDGWARDVLLAWGDTGALTQATPQSAPPAGTPVASGPLVPGLPNLHSHAFQRAFAGLTEYRSSADDSFWSWRDLMYRFALSISPDQLEDIATHLYIEMLQAGYTAVCEFHYLHHDPAGNAYADPAEMSMRLIAAAQRAGIGLTLLTVLFQDAGFDGPPARADQRRFINSVDGLLGMAAKLRATGTRVGVAPHSLRAVGPAALRELIAGVDVGAPVHIHIAEQQQEVRDCVAWSGQRPVQWLLANTAVGAHWCLVHATHMSADERSALAGTGAVVGLCPSTEANLGDGVFDAAAYTAAGGRWGIGSDSHASLDAAEELRLLEYTQRLAHERRNVLAAASMQAQVADHLWLGAVQGGAQASGRTIAGLAVGQQADFVILDTRGALAGLTPEQALANHVFASHGRNTVRDVWVAGRPHVRDCEHLLGRLACDRFVAARSALLAKV